MFLGILLFAIFSLVFAISTLAESNHSATRAWVQSAILLYSTPLLVCAGMAASFGFVQVLPLWLLCSLFAIGAWRAWQAARLLKFDLETAVATRNRILLLRRADQLQTTLKRAARKRSPEPHHRIRSTLYRGLGYFAGAVFVFLAAGTYGLQLLRYVQAVSLFQATEPVGYEAGEAAGEMIGRAFVPSALVLMVWILGVPIFLLATWLLRRAYRWEALEARILRELDPRPPVLLLRSFADDGLGMRRHRWRSKLTWRSPRKNAWAHFRALSQPYAVTVWPAYRYRRTSRKAATARRWPCLL